MSILAPKDLYNYKEAGFFGEKDLKGNLKKTALFNFGIFSFQANGREYFFNA